MNLNWKRAGLMYLAVIVVSIILFSLFMPTPSLEEVRLDEVITMSQSHQISYMAVDSDNLLITTTDGRNLKAYTGNLAIVDLQALGLDLEGIELDVTPQGFDWSILWSFLPLLLFGGLLFFIFRRAQGANNQAMNFGRSRARLFQADRPSVTFADVAGVEEAKQELHEVVDFLKARDKFQRLGARIPRGVLLVGPPGTGKTLLGRAVAGEAGVPFFSISGSEFVEMFVGVGASRVRDLFDQAKRNSPCIVFIDEIDAVGRHRGAGLGGGHDEREQTLNQILTEMDGFDTNIGVIVLAATNRPDILDPALLRPGRFDRRVVLDRPDINGRVAILEVHVKGKPLADTVDLEVIAKQTAGFSGADLSNLVNEAAILAARRGKQVIEMEELEESIDRVIAGPERKNRRISQKEKEITAYHEAGHALVGKMLPNADSPHKISIIARGMALGYTKSLREDRYMWTRAQFKDELATALGGRAAEELIFNEVTTGAQDDIKRVSELARKMVTDFGMSDKLGPRSFGNKQELVFLGKEISEQRDYSEEVAKIIDDEVQEIIENAHQVARKILVKNKAKLIQIAEKLIDKETLEGEELDALFQEKPKSTPTKPKTPSAPVPIPTKVGAKSRTTDKKTPATLPRLVPKQAPATSD